MGEALPGPALLGKGAGHGERGEWGIREAPWKKTGLDKQEGEEKPTTTTKTNADILMNPMLWKPSPSLPPPFSATACPPPSPSSHAPQAPNQPPHFVLLVCLHSRIQRPLRLHMPTLHSSVHSLPVTKGKLPLDTGWELPLALFQNAVAPSSSTGFAPTAADGLPTEAAVLFRRPPPRSQPPARFRRPGSLGPERAAHTHRNNAGPCPPAVAPHPGLAPSSSEDAPNFASRSAAYLQSASPSEPIPGGRTGVRGAWEQRGWGQGGGRGSRVFPASPPAQGWGGREQRGRRGWERGAGLGRAGARGPAAAVSPAGVARAAPLRPAPRGVRAGPSPRAGRLPKQQETAAEGAGPRPGSARSGCFLVFLWEGSETNTMTELVSL